MKKLILLFICFGALISCKKEDVSDLTSKRWVLETAVVSPAITVNGVTTTDYKNLYGAGSCLASNYTLVFNADGSYGFSSNGALCDMLAASKNDKWTREGSTIILTSRYGRKIVATISGDRITYIESSGPGVSYQQVVYTFKAVNN